MRSDLLACYQGFRMEPGSRDFKKGIDAKGMRGGALSARLMVKGPLTDAHFCNLFSFSFIKFFFRSIICVVIEFLLRNILCTSTYT